MEAERQEFERWLAKGYAAGMEYLKRNPHFRTSPARLSPQARSVIILAAGYYSQCPPFPGPGFGRVARYAVGLDYHAVLKSRLGRLVDLIEKETGRPLSAKACTDDVPLYEQALAARSGLGFPGKNTLIIGPRLSGSYFFVAELFVDLDLEPDLPYEGTCGQCFRCGQACPTGAIVSPHEIDGGRCISYLTIENRGEIPPGLRAAIGDWLFGCDVCQEVCPYNQSPPPSCWPEFAPEKGAGHYVDLVGLLDLASENEFKARFGPTPLSRARRRGLLRNALVVLGNQRPERALEPLLSFLRVEEDPLLIEHAAWAVSCYGQGPWLGSFDRLAQLPEPQSSRIRLYREGC